jgi:hypothetical protein
MCDLYTTQARNIRCTDAGGCLALAFNSIDPLAQNLSETLKKY